MSATYLACLTPPGAAAIATLALRGPEAWMLVRGLAQRSLPAEPQVGRFWLTRLGDAARGEVDEVVLTVKRVQPEPWLELHCHGGREVLRLLEELFAARGAQVCTWLDLERRSTGPLHAAALATLANALTTRTATIALDQLHGAFSGALDAICTSLRQGDVHSAEGALGALERWAPLGRHLTSPWRVVVAGAANVGKSSLVNALAGYQRSIVAATPGTTRDVVSVLLAIEGWPIEVADTAGWRATDLPVEQEGIARAREALTAADLCLWVLDASAPPVWPDPNLGPVKLVVNKVDLPPAWPIEETAAQQVSAKTGAGLPQLCQALAAWLVPQIPPPGTAVPFTAAVAEALARARDSLAKNDGPSALAKLEKLGRECG
jgi:tRNA modification GTPase